MKRILFFILYLVFHKTVIARNILSTTGYIKSCGESIQYRPFVEDGKRWIVDYEIWQLFKTETYYIDTDTIVGMKPCKKLICHSEDFEHHKDSTYVRLYIFEENRMVFYFPVIDDLVIQSPILLYDFSAKPDDVICLGGQYDDDMDLVCYQVCNYLSLDVNGNILNGMLATIYDKSNTDVDINADVPLYQWYESIGSIYHPFEKIMHNSFMSAPLMKLRECSVGETLIYSNKTNVDGINDLQLIKDKLSVYYSIDGRRLLSPPEKGVYIENGQIKIRF